MDEFLNWMGTPLWEMSPAALLIAVIAGHLLIGKLSGR